MPVQPTPPSISPFYVSPLEESYKKIINEISRQFKLLLDLEPSFQQGNRQLGKQYGFIVPADTQRSSDSEQKVARGFVGTPVTFDFVYAIVVPNGETVAGHVAAHSQRLIGAIATLNRNVPKGGMLTALTLSEANHRYSQQSAAPYSWEIDFVGSVKAKRFTYYDENGLPQKNNWRSAPSSFTPSPPRRRV